MKLGLHMLVVILGIILATYPWLKGISRVQSNAKLWFSLLAGSALAWGLCGIIGSDKRLLDILPSIQIAQTVTSPKEVLQSIKTFVGGMSCGLALILALSGLQAGTSNKK